MRAKQRIKYFIIFGAIFFLSIGALPACADIIYDDFDGGVLDPAWEVSFDNVSRWDYAITQSRLEVYTIIPTVINDWVTVTLTQSGDSLSDFHLDFDFSWDSGGRTSAMQQIILTLYGSDDEKIASVGYVDAWISYRGSQYAEIGSDIFMPGKHTLPYGGSVATAITRQNGNINILWDGVSILAGVSDTLFSYVTLEFSHIAQNTGYPYYTGSTFGTESVDLIADPLPVPTPEPGTMLLMGLGLLGIFSGRKVYSEKI